MSVLGVTFLAVFKVIVAVLIGAATCKSIPNTSSTIRDFSFMISVILLPCLTIYNTAQTVTLELLVRCSILLFFSVLVIVIGLVSSMVLSKFVFHIKEEKYGIPLELRGKVRLDLLYRSQEVEEVNNTASSKENDKPAKKKPKSKIGLKGTPFVVIVLSDSMEQLSVTGGDVIPQLEVPHKDVELYPGHYWGCMVALSVLNSVTLPLSVFQNIVESVEWLNFDQGSAYIFVFSIVATVHLWAVGPLLVEYAKKRTEKLRTIRLLMERHKKREFQCDVMTQTEVLPNSSVSPVSQAHHLRFPGADALTIDTAQRSEKDTTVDSDSVSSEGIANHTFSEKGTQTMLPAKYLLPVEAVAEQIPYDWEKEGLLHVMYESSMKASKEAEKRSWVKKAKKSFKQLSHRLSTNIPFMSIVVSIVIGLIPFIRNLFFGGPLEMVMDAIGLIASGSIPASLLLLGANLVGSTSNLEESGSGKDVRLRDSEQNTSFPLYEADLALAGEDDALAEQYNREHEEMEPFDLHASFSLHEMMQQRMAEIRPSGVHTRGTTAVSVQPPPKETKPKEESDLKAAFSMENVSHQFVWGVIAARLVIVPAITFVFLLILLKTMPFLFGGRGTEDKTLVYILFAQAAAPTAINSALLLNQADFMTYPWAKMLFFQYLLCTISTVFWTTLGLSITERL